ncbi:DEAD/DEAH box helicase family protein [Emcibacter nanhaiensis]|uniref:DUF4145 domain-containing protein n=1 Tax=Emcibacter nanhaiensis TaxID=1505037 RepID=A0A501PS28_9PROT|nr:DEAD/DEAH box helicase family protein [Emcibacter nanhaiensis]TPD63035.1 DUF4145 domain-containing protein [Emcibacter nanhaiensis]
MSNYKSHNFEFLSGKAPELHKLACFAEHYSLSDPEGALVKLRAFSEQMTKSIYFLLRLPKGTDNTFVGLLCTEEFKTAIPEVVQTKLHAIRKEGNKAAHGSKTSTKTATWLLKETHQLAGWFAVAFLKVDKSDLPGFKEITEVAPEDGEKSDLEKELERITAELNKTQEKYTAAVQALDELQKEQEHGQEVADALALSEAETRKRLIDIALAEVGWDVGENGRGTAEVTQEEKLSNQPTPTGVGYADYVLWDDNGKPLAVIEAKKANKSAEHGRKQAKLYADDLEKTHGQRPVIFYTNGYDIHMWDDVQGYPPRQLFGFYSKESLQYLVNFQRKEKLPLNSLSPNPEIAGRIYQITSIRDVTEKFTDKFRKGLIVQATGTGKTRVAVALSDLLLRAKWAKRVLFLCDRRELRKQAKNAFSDFLSDPVALVGTGSKDEESARILIGTYPGMMSRFLNYDPGYFDLIIADESHRSIYNIYRDLFKYFDGFQIGLTATPVGFINRNTFRMFECEPDNPTAYYTLETAIDQGYLVPYEVYTHTTQFLREGIKYSELTEEQKQELEESDELPEEFNFDASQVDQQVLNKDTNRHIIRNLMENGLKDATGQAVGKSIIFARSHDHAVLLSKVFDEMYPQYGGTFCQVIDSHDSRAEQLIDDFKGEGDNDDLTIAVSVDMLDTGIDVPEVVNLVFAKPVKSKVKFWQMIGRGTRLCPDLYGPGQDKSKFRIFDHWDNFDYFAQEKREAEPSESKSIRQRLFETRMALAELCLEKTRKDDFKLYADLLKADVKALPRESISVRERWKAVESVQQDGVIEDFAPVTVTTLSTDIAPLMRWVNVRGHSIAYSFDLLASLAELALLKGTADFDDHKDNIIALTANLQTNLPQVRHHMEMINRVKSAEFWEEVTVEDLEEMRKALRGIIKLQHEKTGTARKAKVIDITEERSEIHFSGRSSNIRSIDMQVYRLLVEEALQRLFEEDPTLQKIRRGEPVTEHELEQLCSLVLTRNPGVRLEILEDFYPNLAGHLDWVIRSIVGMDQEAVRERFTAFVQTHHSMTAQQIRFLDMLQNHIATNGHIKLEQLLGGEPFTSLHPDGIDGIFDEDDSDQIIEISRQFEFPEKGEEEERQ